MRAAYCLMMLLGAGLPGIARDRCDWEVDFVVPPEGSFRVDALLVPGDAGAEVRAGRGGDESDLRVGLYAADPDTTFVLPGTSGAVVPCVPGRTYRVTITCLPQEEGWAAWVCIFDPAARETLFAGMVPLGGRPDGGCVRAAEVLDLDLS